MILVKKFNTSDRLKQIMSERNLKQVDILNLANPYCKKYNIKLNKSDLSQYVNGKVEPGQNKLYILALALNVNEAWLMGFDNVPIERNPENKHNKNTFLKTPLSFSQKLHNKRIETGLSIEELAEASGISVSEIKNYEYGISKPKNENQIQMLAKALNTEYFNLLADDTSAIKVADSGFNGNPISDSKKSHSENLLISNFNSLNKQGKDKLLEYSDDLVSSGKYLKTEQKKSTPKN